MAQHVHTNGNILKTHSFTKYELLIFLKSRFKFWSFFKKQIFHKICRSEFKFENGFIINEACSIQICYWLKIALYHFSIFMCVIKKCLEIQSNKLKGYNISVLLKTIVKHKKTKFDFKKNCLRSSRRRSTTLTTL